MIGVANIHKSKLIDQYVIFQKEIKQKKKIQGSRRQSSYAYNLQLQDGSTHQVWKPLFASTFGVPERTLMSWITDRGDSSSAASSSDSLSAAKTPYKPGPKSGLEACDKKLWPL